MRGKRFVVAAASALAGITPADAGKTLRSLASVRSSQDHPRGCGENFYSVGLAAYDTGSPPRMRGKLVKNLYGSR